MSDADDDPLEVLGRLVESKLGRQVGLNLFVLQIFFTYSHLDGLLAFGHLSTRTHLV